jgi:hypothetical protein
VKSLFRRGRGPVQNADSRLEAERGRVLLDERLEIVVVLVDDGRVVPASRRARELID